jgi:putative ABC transport system substrate-binding protein
VIAAFAKAPNGGLILGPASTNGRNIRQSILLLAVQHQLPVIHWDRDYPAEGGLMSYGSDTRYLFVRSASYVDSILRGAKVNDLPVQFPTKFELVINIRAAKPSISPYPSPSSPLPTR